MADDLIAATNKVLETGNGAWSVPTLVARAGGDAKKRFIEFFAAQIRKRNTREAYVRAVVDFFDWAEEIDIGGLLDIEPIHVAAWVELKTQAYEPQTVKQKLAALPL